MAIEWTPDLAVGEPTIDAQHQEIFRRVDGLLESMKKGQGKGEIGAMLEYLGAYVVEHFGAEERAMAAVDDPNLALHRAEHAQFIADYQAMRARYLAQGVNTALVIDVNDRVCTWLRNHIARTDKRLAVLLRARKRTP